MPLPPDAVITVRVEDASDAGMPPDVLGSQTIQRPGAPRLPSASSTGPRTSSCAGGSTSRRAFSFGGKVRYYNLNRYVVTLGNASDPHRIYVNPDRPVKIWCNGDFGEEGMALLARGTRAHTLVLSGRREARFWPPGARPVDRRR